MHMLHKIKYHIELYDNWLHGVQFAKLQLAHKIGIESFMSTAAVHTVNRSKVYNRKTYWIRIFYGIIRYAVREPDGNTIKEARTHKDIKQ